MKNTATCTLDEPLDMRTDWHGERARELRKLAKLTLQQVAELVDVSFSVIAMWERDEARPTYEAFMQLADAYNVDCNAFRQEVGEKPIRRRRSRKPESDEE